MDRTAETPDSGLDPRPDTICLRGAKAICAAVGESPKNITDLVLRKGLPAWKDSPLGCWRALPEDLRTWLKNRRDECRARMLAAAAAPRGRAFAREPGRESA